jgi:regulator of sigma E protease
VDTFWTLVQLILGLEIIILVHIVGHFLAAKILRIQVEKFSLGFGPTLPGCRFWSGQTTFSIGLFPLGGYVKMACTSHEISSHNFLVRLRVFAQNLAVIFSGMVMNVVLAWTCFVLVDWSHGQERIPGVVDRIEPGSPAWEKGMRSGDVIYWFGDKGPRPSFEDIRATIVNSAKGEQYRVTFGPPNALEKDLIHTQIEPRRDEGDPRPVIGITPPMELELFPAKYRQEREMPVVYTSAAAKANPPFEFGDSIIATSDQDQPDQISPLPRDPLNSDDLEKHDYFSFQRRLFRLAGREMTIQVRRQGPAQTMDIHVPPAYHYIIGVRMQMGPITAVRDNSPASKAGVQPGDVIDDIIVTGDNPIKTFTLPIDPSRLPFEVDQWAQKQGPGEKKVSLKLFRAHRFIVLGLQWEQGWEFNNESPVALSSPLSIPSLGIAYRIETTVEKVEPGQPAEKAGLQPADVIRAVRFQNPGKTQGEQGRPGRWIDLKSDQWAFVFERIQEVDQKKIDLRVERGPILLEVSLIAQEDATWPRRDRGLILMPASRLERAKGPGQAMVLGVRRTFDNINQLLAGWRSYYTGRISYQEIAGPVTVARLSYRFARDDTHHFIFLLAILSVSFALQNLLPIPVFDGGDLVFLALEFLRGKPFSARTRRVAIWIGLGLLLLLFVGSIFQDMVALASG